MQYALLIYEERAGLRPGQGRPRDSDDDGQAHGLRSRCGGRRYAGGSGLKDTDSATTVRTHAGKQTIHDGPFAETKEQLGGFYLIDVPDLDAAIAVARRAAAPQRRLGRDPSRPGRRMSAEALDRQRAMRAAASSRRWPPATRNLDVAEEAFAEACLRAAEAWACGSTPTDPAAWLYRVADRCALDALRKTRIRGRFQPEPPEPEASAEDALMDESRLIPDERLRLIFVCCHPAVAVDARAALTLRLVCGLSTAEIARALPPAGADAGAAAGASQAQDRRCRDLLRGTGAGGLAGPACRRCCPRSRSPTPRRMRMRRAPGSMPAMPPRCSG